MESLISELSITKSLQDSSNSTIKTLNSRIDDLSKEILSNSSLISSLQTNLDSQIAFSLEKDGTIFKLKNEVQRNETLDVLLSEKDNAIAKFNTEVEEMEMKLRQTDQVVET